MIDRVATAAGGLADSADRAARTVLRGPRFATRPVSLVVAAGLVVVAVLAVLASLETPGGDGPRTLGAGDIAALDDSPGRIGAVVSGGLAMPYAEYFQDLDLDGVYDEGEPTIEWDYFLVDPVSGDGVTVRSQRPVDEVFRTATSGRVVEDATAIQADVDWFWQELEVAGLHLDRARYIDATEPTEGPAHDLTTALPAGGTPLSIEGSRSVGYVPICRDGGAGWCEDAEAVAFDVLVYDPDSQQAVMVRTADSPAYPPVTIQGVLRRDAGGIAGALEGTGWHPSELEFQVSPRLILVEGATAPSGVPLLLLAVISVALAGLIAIGIAAGYVGFRPEPAEPATSDAPAGTSEAAIPLRVTGRLHARGGDVHVREAPAELQRFATTSAEDAPTTLIVQRQEHAEGVAVGPGEVRDVERGRVRSVRWERPALRLSAATGPLVLTFDDTASRDRAALELAADPASEAPDPDATTLTSTDDRPTQEEEPWTPGS